MGIRVPRITVNADFAEDAALGDLTLLSVGYGLHQAWVFATMFGATSVFGIQAYLTGMNDMHVTAAYLVSIIVYVACLLFAAATDQRFLRFYISRKTLAAASAMGCAGTVLLALSGTGDLVALEIASGVLTGLGSSMLILFWGTAFARCDTSSIVLNTSLGVVMGVAVYVLLLHSAPVPFTGLMASAIPLLELAVLWNKTPRPYSERDGVPIFKPLPVNRAKFFARFATPTLIMGLALGTLRQTSIQASLPATDLADQLLLLLAAGCATVIMLITIMIQGRGDQWNRYFRPLVPLIAVALLFLPSARSGSDLLPNLALLIGYLSFEAMMWVFFGMLAQRFRMSPVLVFGLGRGMLAAGILAGSLIPVIDAGWLNALPFGEQGVAMTMLVAMFVAYALLPREREIESIVAPCPAVRAVSVSLENAPLAVSAAPTQSPAEPNLAAREPSPSNPQDLPDPSNLPDPQGPTPPGHGPSASAPAGAPSADGSPASFSAASFANLSPARQAMLRHPSSARLAAMSLQPAVGADQKADGGGGPADGIPGGAGRPLAASEGRQRGGRFRAKCETVANAFLLSRRETEVMFFLAKGHNAAYIQEKLYISEGTAKTHIRHIYRKLDIHTQQELMRMVESAEASE